MPVSPFFCEVDMKKIQEWLDSYRNSDPVTKLFIVGVLIVSVILFFLLLIFLNSYFGIILLLASILLVVYSDEIGAYLSRKSNSNNSCIDSCIGCDAVYPYILTCVYDALKIVSPILHLSIPPTERQIQSICPPRPDGLPRCAFRVMRKTDEESVSDEDILSCFRQTLQDSFVSHGSSFLCTGVKDLYVEEVKQDDFSVTFYIMPYCPSRTASCINQLKRREQVQKDRLAAKHEEHVYDDQI